MSPLARSAAVILSAILSVAAAGGSSTAQEDEPRGSLYVLTRSECIEDYAAELAAAGIETKLSAFDTLAAIAKFLRVPADVEVRHILFIRGYAVVNHVAPDRVTDLLSSMPRVTGLVGTSECGPTGGHANTHDSNVTAF